MPGISTTIEKEEDVITNTRQGDFHTVVADTDRDILNCASGRLGRPARFRKVYFSFHREARLGLGVSGTRDGGIPPGMSLQHG